MTWKLRKSFPEQRSVWLMHFEIAPSHKAVGEGVKSDTPFVQPIAARGGQCLAVHNHGDTLSESLNLNGLPDVRLAMNFVRQPTAAGVAVPFAINGPYQINVVGAECTERKMPEISLVGQSKNDAVSQSGAVAAHLNLDVVVRPIWVSEGENLPIIFAKRLGDQFSTFDSPFPFHEQRLRVGCDGRYGI